MIVSSFSERVVRRETPATWEACEGADSEVCPRVGLGDSVGMLRLFELVFGFLGAQ